KINTKGETLPNLDFSDSKNVEVGDLVLAIGNPFGVGQSVSSGIISALARTQIGGGDYQFFIQTDAAVNPGNSGGALIGMDGKLVGINSAIFTRSGGSNGIGFAIPVKMVDHVVAAALSGNKLIRPWFGASGQAVTADIAESLGFDRPGGVLVDNIFSGSPADRAGLKQGDVILSVDGEEIFDTGGLRYHIGLMNPGGQMSVVVLSGEVRKTLTVVLEVAPEVPPRDITVLKGKHIFENIQVANLSPAFSEEIGVDMFEKGVIILEVGGNSPVRRLGVVRPGDIFETIDDEKIETVNMLEKALADGSNRVSFSVRREGRLIECNVGNRGGYFCQ
ncbi:MAG: PDZ domain-containing protein, partial [Proteobacteria bacterium]|nr:PDZ domain-containing protein [Pseudomonadota bacterium]